MSYYYDKLMNLAKQMGKSLQQIAAEMGIPSSTVRKWKNRNPHDKYRPKINQFLNERRSFLTSQVQPVASTRVPYDIVPVPLRIECDEDGVPRDFWDDLTPFYRPLSMRGGLYTSLVVDSPLDKP